MVLRNRGGRTAGLALREQQGGGTPSQVDHGDPRAKGFDRKGHRCPKGRKVRQVPSHIPARQVHEVETYQRTEQETQSLSSAMRSSGRAEQSSRSVTLLLKRGLSFLPSPP